MFRHLGKRRSLKHNLKIASLLSFVAGIVNITGFLAVQRLTTNVTGHFAFFIDELFKFNIWQGLAYFLYIFCFFLGSFVSGYLVEVMFRRHSGFVYVIPTLVESFLLLLTGSLGHLLMDQGPDMLAFILLFAMGMQNSLVTNISNSIVRTTHLTGLFTDLGIELSQLFFYRQQEDRKRLTASIRLRLTIIAFFFLGGVIGGVLFPVLKLYVLTLAGLVLFVGISYDYVKLRVILNKRKVTS